MSCPVPGSGYTHLTTHVAPPHHCLPSGTDQLSSRPRCRQQKVEVTIYTHRNGTVRVEDSEADLYASIDLVCDKVGGSSS
jgi:ribosome-associated translation inhibitor RaiA